jgi:hypothetical protein
MLRVQTRSVPLSLGPYRRKLCLAFVTSTSTLPLWWAQQSWALSLRRPRARGAHVLQRAEHTPAPHSEHAAAARFPHEQQQYSNVRRGARSRPAPCLGRLKRSRSRDAPALAPVRAARSRARPRSRTRPAAPGSAGSLHRGNRHRMVACQFAVAVVAGASARAAAECRQKFPQEFAHVTLTARPRGVSMRVGAIR